MKQLSTKDWDKLYNNYDVLTKNGVSGVFHNYY